MTICQHPNAVQTYRDTTKRHGSMVGVMSPRRLCACCNNYKTTGGGKRVEGGFVCKECSEGKD